MNRIIMSRVVCSVVICLISPFSQAANVAVAPQLSFPKGAGFEVITKLSPYVNGRVGLNTLKFDSDFTLDQIDYTSDVDLKSFSMLADWYPYAGNFRLSFGMMVNKSDIRVGALGSDSYQIGNEIYRGALSLDGRMEFRPVAPYLGVGWGDAVSADRRWGVNFDVGVLMAGQLKVVMEASGIVTDSSGSTIDVSNESVFQDNLAREVANIQDDLDRIKILPVLSASVSYRF